MELLTESLKERFQQFPYGSQVEKGLDAEIIVKYFNPCGVGEWLITEAEEYENDWILYGYCSLGFGFEYGPVSLRELSELQLPFNLTIERDLYLPEGTKVGNVISTSDLM